MNVKPPMRGGVKGFKPQRTNLYAEMGSTFAATVTSRPMECAHMLGTLLRESVQIMSCGYRFVSLGNPQWQIEAFRKFQIPDQLVEGYGYPRLTPEITAKVFGQNAARVWNLKATAWLPGRGCEARPQAYRRFSAPRIIGTILQVRPAKYAKVSAREEIAKEHELQKVYKRMWLPPPLKHSRWD